MALIIDRVNVAISVKERHSIEVGLVVRVGLSTDGSALDTPSLHKPCQCWLSPQECFVIIPTTVQSLRDAVKPVQVELSLEGRKLGLAKVFGHHDLVEQPRLMNDETPTMWLP